LIWPLWRAQSAFSFGGWSGAANENAGCLQRLTVRSASGHGGLVIAAIEVFQ